MAQSSMSTQSADTPEQTVANLSEKQLSHITHAAQNQLHETGGDEQKAINILTMAIASHDAVTVNTDTIEDVLRHHGTLRSTTDGKELLTDIETVGTAPGVLSQDTDPDEDDLTVIDNVGDAYEEAMKASGLTTVEDVASATPATIATIDGISYETAEDIKKSAGSQLDPLQMTAAHIREWMTDHPRAEFETDAVGMDGAQRHIRDVDFFPGEPTDDSFHALPVLHDIGHPHVASFDGEFYEQSVTNDHPYDDVTDNGLSGTAAQQLSGALDYDTEDITNVELASRIIAEPRSCLLLEGPPGVAKDTMIQFLSAQTNWPVVRVDLGRGSSYRELLGTREVTSDDEGMNVELIAGKLLRAMKYGWWIVLSEMNMMNGDVSSQLHAAAEEDPVLDLNSQGMIQAHPGFRMIGTQNPVNANNSGTKPLNGAWLTRFQKLPVTWADKDDEVQLIHRRVNSPFHRVERDDIRWMVDKAANLRRASTQDANVPAPSPRDVEQAAANADMLGRRTAFVQMLDGLIKPHHTRPEHIADAAQL